VLHEGALNAVEAVHLAHVHLVRLAAGHTHKVHAHQLQQQQQQQQQCTEAAAPATGGSQQAAESHTPARECQEHEVEVAASINLDKQ
jgi:uracil phosphoribosyltransferase